VPGRISDVGPARRAAVTPTSEKPATKLKYLQPLCFGITDRLSEQRPLFGSQIKRFREARPVAIVEPCRQPVGRGENMHIPRYETRIDKVIRFLNFRFVQSRFVKAVRMRQATDIYYIDELNRCARLDTLLAWRHGSSAQIYPGDRYELALDRIVQIGAVVHCDIDIDLL